jgi:hypothetical protein
MVVVAERQSTLRISHLKIKYIGAIGASNDISSKSENPDLEHPIWSVERYGGMGHPPFSKYCFGNFCYAVK